MNKELSYQIAKALLSKKKTAVTKLENEFSKQLTAEYESQIPKSVLKAFKEYRGYMNYTDKISIHGPGFANCYGNQLTKTLPEHLSERGVKLAGERADHFRKLLDQVKDADNAYTKLYKEIVNALQGLSSFARIQKELPEAVPYLPKSTSQALQINLSDLRERIKS